MKRISLLFMLFIGSRPYEMLAQQVYTNYIRYVNPFVGSEGDHGQLSPAATVPFGVVKPGPETDPGNHSGYNYASKLIRGFTINRIEGTGCIGTGGNILIKPGLGKTDSRAYPYNKRTEQASPGYYQVSFEKPEMLAELTATNGTGLEKFTFREGGKGWIMLDLSASYEKIIKEEHTIRGNEISGSIHAPAACRLGGYQFYYNVHINKPCDSVSDKGSVIWYYFTVNKGESVTVATSVSSVGTQQAVAQRELEVNNRSFEQVRNEATALWNEKLGRIQVSGKDEYVRLFYTHYYHALLSPSRLAASSETYRGSDAKLYTAKGHAFYHGWSIWDNFRTQLPLLTITEPDIMNDICASLTELYKQGKVAWTTNTEPFPTVRTEHALVVLLDCYRKGITKYDLAGVYPLLVKESEHYLYSTPDQKLETCYDWWALSNIAAILNKKEDAEIFRQNALRYKEIWEQKFRVMNDKSDIMHGDSLYEGTLWQYRWAVPFDIDGIKQMLGGEAAFTSQLEYFFDNNLYNHGNQPDIQVPFLFNYTSRPYRTQELVSRILTGNMEQWYGTHKKWDKPYVGRIYQLAPKGYIPEMDDDVGTMSAWYVLAAAGLYPSCPGNPYYALTAPIFSKVVINLKGGKSFKIIAENLTDKNIYIQKIYLNGKVLRGYWLSHGDILKGGTLRIVLGDKPLYL